MDHFYASIVILLPTIGFWVGVMIGKNSNK